jgi:hypothetical protein
VVFVLVFNFFIGDDGSNGNDAKVFFPQGTWLVMALCASGTVTYTCLAIWFAGSDKLAMYEVEALLSRPTGTTAATSHKAKAAPALLPALSDDADAAAPAAAIDADPLVVVEEASHTARSDDEAKRLAARLRRGSPSPPR